jgi:hypothetical protein
MGGMLGHNGAQTPLYTSEMWYSPARHGSVVVLFNTYDPCESPKPFPQTGELADATAVSLARIAYGSSLSRAAGQAVSCQKAGPVHSG